MSSVVLGVLAACGASAMFNLSIAMQALEARAEPGHDGLRPTLLAGLLRRRRWVLGTLLGVVGWPLQLLALLLAPLTVVQPTLGLGLILLLVLASRALHERVGHRDVAAVLAIVAGVAVVGLTAPSHEGAPAPALRTAIVLTAIGVLSVAPYVFGPIRRRTAGGRLIACSAGAAYGWSGISSKLLADALSDHRWGVALAWAAATGVASGFALLSEMTALQRRRATEVAPLLFVLEVLVPVLTAPLLVGEAWTGSASGTIGVLAGLTAVLGGAVVLTSSPTVAAFVQRDHDPPPATARPAESTS